MRELSLAVVGIDYPNDDRAGTNRRSELMLLPRGTAMALVPEPKNKHDENAVAVFSPSGIRVGYLRAERAPFIGARLRAGEEVNAVLQGILGAAAWIRVRFGPGLPNAPSVSESPPKPKLYDDPDGFYPDPDGPEWGA